MASSFTKSSHRRARSAVNRVLIQMSRSWVKPLPEPELELPVDNPLAGGKLVPVRFGLHDKIVARKASGIPADRPRCACGGLLDVCGECADCATA